MIETVVAEVNRQVVEDGLSREVLENRVIRILEEEGFDSLVQLLWDAMLIAYTIGFVEEMREDIVDGVLASG